MNYRINKVPLAGAASIAVAATLALYAASFADPRERVSAATPPLCIEGIPAIQALEPPTDTTSQTHGDADISPNSVAASPLGGIVMLIDELVIAETTTDRN